MLYPELSKKILDAVFSVHKELGPGAGHSLRSLLAHASGLLEQCYHNALYYELQTNGLAVQYNEPFSVAYKGQPVGEYYADLTVNGKIIIEIKSVQAFGNTHIAQLQNYLHISRCRLGFLVNFQNSHVEFKRLVL